MKITKIHPVSGRVIVINLQIDTVIFFLSFLYPSRYRSLVIMSLISEELRC